MSYLCGWLGVAQFMRERFFPLSIGSWFLAVLVCSICTVFGACAIDLMQQRSAKQPEAVSAPTVSAQPVETAPLMYYAGVDQLIVYSEPRSSSSSVTQLPLYQK